MKVNPLLCPLVRLLTAAALVAPAMADEPFRQPSEALVDFQKAWKPLTGRQYMRPFDDVGWKARLVALKNLACAGEKAVPVLTEALKKGDDETRLFAAQALALLPYPAARVALTEALWDKHPAVRLYALDALSMFGKLPEEQPYLALRQEDTNRDVRSHAAFAMERDDKPQLGVIRQALCDYDTKSIGTAKVGEGAPDFTLISAAGKQVTLSDFRGKKVVVLVFVYGAT